MFCYISENIFISLKMLIAWRVPLWCSRIRIWLVTAVAWVTTMAWALSLAQELVHAVGMDKKMQIWLHEHKSLFHFPLNFLMSPHCSWDILNVTYKCMIWPVYSISFIILLSLILCHSQELQSFWKWYDFFFRPFAYAVITLDSPCVPFLHLFFPSDSCP